MGMLLGDPRRRRLARAVTRWMGRSRPSLPRCAGQLNLQRLQAADAALKEQWLVGAAGDLGRLHSKIKRR